MRDMFYYDVELHILPPDIELEYMYKNILIGRVSSRYKF